MPILRSNLRPGTELRFLVLVASCVFGGGACHSEPSQTREVGSAVSSAEQTMRAVTTQLRVAERQPFARSTEDLPREDPLERLTPPEQPNQRLAFSRYRLAVLEGERLAVRRLPGFQIAADVSVPDARNVVSPVGGGFLVAGRDYLYRVSPTDTVAERFPRVPRIGPTTILPSLLDSQQFWLEYEGIATLPSFDLAEVPATSLLPVVSWTVLPDFDRRALLAYGEGSVVYTVADGLRRIGADAHQERLPLPEITGRIWGLARSSRWDQVWAATSQHLYLLIARGVPRIVERYELPPHTVAMASLDRELALLSVEALEPSRARLRVDLYTQGTGPGRVLRLEDFAPPAADAGPRREFLPQIALAPLGDLLAIRGFGVHVYDAHLETELFPVPAAAQNLAPAPP